MRNLGDELDTLFTFAFFLIIATLAGGIGWCFGFLVRRRRARKMEGNSIRPQDPQPIEDNSSEQDVN